MTPASAVGGPQRQTAERVFILDDDADVRAFIATVAAKNGFKAEQFANPLSLLVQLKINPPNLVVLDLALGQSDAIEVIRQLATIRYCGRLLLVSGRDAITLAEVEKIGARHGIAMLPSLRKPFRSQVLVDAMRAGPAEKKASNVAEADSVARPSASLEEALRNEWLELWYQPKIDLKSLSVCGAEGLLRARHPKYGIVLPAAMLPPSESPLYQPLYKYVIQRAMSDWASFAGQGAILRLAINLPLSTTCAADFIGNMRRLLSTDPRFPGLIIEITEDDLRRDATWTREVATQLKLYNVFLSIDEFGSAHSSLSELVEVPCVEVKLDRRFVRGCAADERKREVCKTVITLAHRFGATACAVGVENTEDLQALIGLGCDAAQGFLFAKPAAPADFLAMMRASVGPVLAR